MRTLGFRSHALLAVAGAVGVISALGRPWYGAAPALVLEDDPSRIADLNGPIEGYGAALARWVAEPQGTSGWEALGTWGTVLAALAALTAAGALACLVPAIQGVAREVVRYGSLASVALVGWKLVDAPGPFEPRQGALLAAIAAIVALASGAAVAAAPLQRR